MIVRRPWVIHDIPYIVANVSQQHSDELVAMGLTDEACCTLAGYYLGKGPAEIGEIDGRPVAVFGYFPEGDRTIIWFLATSEYFALGSHGIRYARRYLKALHESGIGDLWDRAFVHHPDAERWLEVLGFVQVQQGWFLHRGVSGRE